MNCKPIQTRALGTSKCTNHFSAWIPNTDLNPLEPHSCKDVSEKGKAKALIAAYHVAAENHDLQYFKGILVEHAERLQEEADAAAARDAEKAAKAEKKKRKSEAATVEKDDVDMEDADDTTATKKSSKKRKKDVESDDEETEKVCSFAAHDLSTNDANSLQRLQRPSSS